MKKKLTHITNKIIVLFFVAFVFPQVLLAENIGLQNRQKKFSAATDATTNFYSQKDFFSKVLPENNQSPARRAEVVFFISLPLVLLSHFLIASAVTLGQSSSITSFDMSPETGIFLGVSSLFVSGAITVFDHYNHFKKKKKEPQVSFSLKKKF